MLRENWLDNLDEYQVRDFCQGLVDEIEDHGSLTCLYQYVDEWREIAITMGRVEEQELFERREGRE